MEEPKRLGRVSQNIIEEDKRQSVILPMVVRRRTSAWKLLFFAFLLVFFAFCVKLSASRLLSESDAAYLTDFFIKQGIGMPK